MLINDFQTTDATPVTVWSYNLAPASSLTIHIDLEGVQTDGSNVTAGTMAGTFRREAGNSILVSDADGDFIGVNTFRPTSTSPRIQFSTSGSTCRAIWTGKADTTIRVKTKIAMHLNEP